MKIKNFINLVILCNSVIFAAQETTKQDFTPEEMEQFPASVREVIIGHLRPIESVLAFAEMKKLEPFICSILSCSSVDKEKIKQILKNSEYFFDFINLPKELNEEFKALLTFEKPGVLALFGPQGEALFNYLMKLATFLGQAKSYDFQINDFRNIYVETLLVGDLGEYPCQDFELLAEIIEFGTKNNFRFDQMSNFTLNKLSLPANLPKEIAARIISCLPYLVNWQDHWGFSPLMDAAHRGNLDIVKLLIKHRANLEIKSTRFYQNVSSNSNALDIAIAHNNLEMINLLLHSGADLNNAKITNFGGNEKLSDAIANFKAQHKEIINSALHDELPQVLVNIVFEYLEKK